MFQVAFVGDGGEVESRFGLIALGSEGVKLGLAFGFQEIIERCLAAFRFGDGLLQRRRFGRVLQREKGFAFFHFLSAPDVQLGQRSGDLRRDENVFAFGIALIRGGFRIRQT